jgi:Na+-driven multidrug efflux pump
MQPAEERPSIDSIVKDFIRIALPTTWGLIAVTIVSVADTAFIGAIGPNALAAIGIVIPFVMIISNANIGIVNSLTPLFAEQEKHHSAVRLALRATTLLLTINTLLLFPGLVWGHKFFKTQAPNVKVLQYCTEYWNTALLGILILIPLLIVSIVLRTRGQEKESGILFTISALVNFSADFLLVQGNVGFPALGVQGSALATNIGWMIGLVYGIWVLFKQGIWGFSFTMFQPLQTVRECLSILYFGIPGAISQSALPFSSALIIATVTRNGALDVAAFMIATGIESILMIVGIGVSTIENGFEIAEHPFPSITVKV